MFPSMYMSNYTITQSNTMFLVRLFDLNYDMKAFCTVSGCCVYAEHNILRPAWLHELKQTNISDLYHHRLREHRHGTVGRVSASFK